MPRKPKQEKKRITVVANGKAITVSLYPPSGSRTSWYAFWTGLSTSKSTGHSDYASAVLAVENMFRNGGHRSTVSDTIISDVEFEEIQRRHFGKRNDIASQVRAAKSLDDCLEAISAFREISGVSPIAVATPDDCERFQMEALKKLRNWRKRYPNSKKDGVVPIKANTVIKWSRTLQAAFERANKNAGKKCVRGVVDETKLLVSNPWQRFTWIDGTEPKKRRFTNDELLSVLDYFETTWPQVTVATSFAKLSLWIWARRSEVAGLQWEDLRVVRGQYHFDFVGKWGVRKWARIPVGLYEELCKVRSKSPFVFAAYSEQLRLSYAQNPVIAKKVGMQYSPTAFGDWFHDKLVEWSESAPNGHATQHAFRKTGLQLAYRGGVTDAKIAADASITEAVMLDHYVDETDEELLLKSNRTFDRIVASLPLKVAQRYGYCPGQEGAGFSDVLKAAIDRQDWEAVKELAQRVGSDGPLQL